MPRSPKPAPSNKLHALALIVAIQLCVAVTNTDAAELKVFVGGAMTDTIEKIGAEYARTSGHTLSYVSDTTGALMGRLRAGEQADVIVITAGAMDELQRCGALLGASRADLVQALIGVAMKPGTRRPDLSTAQSFKAALLAAKSVAYVNPKAGGTSGTYFEGLLSKMGIAAAMKAKTVYRNKGAEVAEAVARGDAQFGISFIAELATNKGVIVAGALPDSIQMPTTYAAAVPAHSANANAARAYIAAMVSATGAEVFKAAGLQPLGTVTGPIPDISTLNPAAIKLMLPEDIHWKPAAGLPGTDSYTLVGNPAKPGFYIVLNRFHPGAFSHPHYHLNDRHILVLSGTWWVGTGVKWDPENAAVPLKAGTYALDVGRQVHYDGARTASGEVIVAIFGEGPGTRHECDGPTAETGDGPCADARAAAGIH